MTIFRFALLRIFRNRVNLALLTLFPVACIFSPGAEYWPALPYGYHYFGILILFVGIRLAAIMMEDRIKGVVKRLAIAPVSYARYLTQNMLAFAVVVGLQCLIVVYGGVLAGRELHKPLWLLLLFVSFAFASVAIALAWISIYRSKEAAFLVYMSLVLLAALLGGVLVPMEMFPEPLKRIAFIMPTYWLTAGMNWIAYGAAVADFLLINGVLWLYAVIFIIIGSMRKMH